MRDAKVWAAIRHIRHHILTLSGKFVDVRKTTTLVSTLNSPLTDTVDGQIWPTTRSSQWERWTERLGTRSKPPQLWGSSLLASSWLRVRCTDAVLMFVNSFPFPANFQFSIIFLSNSPGLAYFTKPRLSYLPWWSKHVGLWPGTHFQVLWKYIFCLLHRVTFPHHRL